MSDGKSYQQKILLCINNETAKKASAQTIFGSLEDKDDANNARIRGFVKREMKKLYAENLIDFVKRSSKDEGKPPFKASGTFKITAEGKKMLSSADKPKVKKAAPKKPVAKKSTPVKKLKAKKSPKKTTTKVTKKTTKKSSEAKVTLKKKTPTKVVKKATKKTIKTTTAKKPVAKE